MKKASEYHQHAEECRDMASRATSEEQRQTLIKMADTWDSLGSEREAMLAQKQRIDDLIS
jgi:hypothetical protein